MAPSSSRPRPTSGMLPAPGEEIAGKFRVVRRLGSGGMGVVFEALHLRLGHRVALKFLAPHLLANRVLVTRFEQEGRIAAQLCSPHTGRIHDVDTLPSGLPFIVMELLHGCSLDEELRLRGPLPVGEAVDLVLAACASMAEAHALGIVHRDLKPANLFLAREGRRRTAKVLDFGVSKIVHAARDSEVTETVAVLGTPAYMSPEQVRSAKRVDHRTDIWSLGVVLYRCLAGRPPFQAENAVALGAVILSDPPFPLGSACADLPPGLEDIVIKALAKLPSRRYQTVSELAEALAPFAATPGLAHDACPPSRRSGELASFEARAGGFGLPSSATSLLASTVVTEVPHEREPVTGASGPVSLVDEPLATAERTFDVATAPKARTPHGEERAAPRLLYLAAAVALVLSVAALLLATSKAPAPAFPVQEEPAAALLLAPSSELSATVPPPAIAAIAPSSSASALDVRARPRSAPPERARSKVPAPAVAASVPAYL